MTTRMKAGRFETIADMLYQLGGISPKRVRAFPLPGTATEKDVVAIHDRTGRLFELVDGVLVEKAMGFLESSLACDLIGLLKDFLRQHDLGFLAGEAGAMRLMPGLVRIPDVSFVSWGQLPSRERPEDPIARVAPDLAVEVLSEGNTKREMARKVREYFLSGTRLVWFVDPARRAVEVFSAPDESVVLAEGQTLEGGAVLPGLALPVREVFAGLPRKNGSGAGPGRPARRKPRKPGGRA